MANTQDTSNDATSILTDDAIHNLIVDFEIECDYGIETTPVDNIVPFSRAIEQDVLQSSEIQRLRDIEAQAERIVSRRGEDGNYLVLTADLDRLSDAMEQRK